MSALTTVFGDGIIDVHVANGVARITLGAAVGGQQAADAKPVPSGMVVVPVMQLPAFARVIAEVTRQVEQRAKEALAQAQAKAAEAGAPAADQVGGAFRFNG